MSAAVRVIATQGLSAATAAIAKEAGVSNGSLFTYFETKGDLLNQLYVELKTEVATAAVQGVAIEIDRRSQLFHMCRQWLQWAVSYPDKRRALAHLSVSDDITPQSRKAAKLAMAGIALLIERNREEGLLRDVPLGFVADLLNAIADTTADFMISDPANADEYARTSIEAIWKVLS